jgi:hypothetical protein
MTSNLPTSVAADAPRPGAFLWAAAHALPLVILPVATLSVGPLVGLDTAAAITHASTSLVVPLLQGRALRSLVSNGPSWTTRGVLGLGAAIAVAMLLMSSIDLAGYDDLATPFAMCIAGAVHGGILYWPLRNTGRWRAATLVSAMGWLIGTGIYRTLLPAAIRWELFGRSPYGYAYVGGHNELLWIGAGLLGFGLLTAPFLLRTGRSAKLDAAAAHPISR